MCIRDSLFTGKIKEKYVAVKGAAFDVEEGKTIGIVGESGSGKSTIGEIVGGLQKPTYGCILYFGKNIKELSEEEYHDYRKSVQFIFQDPKGSMAVSYTHLSCLLQYQMLYPLIFLYYHHKRKRRHQNLFHPLHHKCLQRQGHLFRHPCPLFR